jgi:diguanylate cyclase (GGDEF)-like protein/PAS domain S-box-containing protein
VPPRPSPEPTFTDLAEIATDGVYLVDARRTILAWNPAAERISGWSADAVIGRRCYDAILRHVDASGRLLCHGACPLVTAMRERCPHAGTVWLHHRAGHRVEVEVHVRPLFDAEGRVTGAVETFRQRDAHDDERALLAEAREEAVRDPLTGLANRRLATTRLGQRLDDLREHGLGFACVMADLDHFKDLNDEHGHNAGDRALRAVGDTIRSAVRAQDLAARWGGEEFLVILHGAGLAEGREVAERMRALIGACEVEVEGGVVPLAASVGVTDARSGDDAESLVGRVDELLYAAKAAGRNMVVAG